MILGIKTPKTPPENPNITTFRKVIVDLAVLDSL